MRNCCKVPSALSARHLTLIHNKMSLTVNPDPDPDPVPDPAPAPARADNEIFTRCRGRVLAVVLPSKVMKAAATAAAAARKLLTRPGPTIFSIFFYGSSPLCVLRFFRFCPLALPRLWTFVLCCLSMCAASFWLPVEGLHSWLVLRKAVISR